MRRKLYKSIKTNPKCIQVLQKSTSLEKCFHSYCFNWNGYKVIYYYSEKSICIFDGEKVVVGSFIGSFPERIFLKRKLIPMFEDLKNKADIIQNAYEKLKQTKINKKTLNRWSNLMEAQN